MSMCNTSTIGPFSVDSFTERSSRTFAHSFFITSYAPPALAIFGVNSSNRRLSTAHVGGGTLQ